MVWNEGLNSGAGGGGESLIFERPCYQEEKTDAGMRGVPDISAMAAPLPGCPVYSGPSPQGQSGWLQIGGTSASSPFFASQVAIMNAKEAKSGRPLLGFLNPALYDMPTSAIYDIRKGNNKLFNNGCCDATKGYDLASELGAPNLRPMHKAFPYYGSRVTA